jgi:putative flippase GtrA
MFTPHFTRLRSFAHVGAIGFIVEAAILTSLTQWTEWTPWQARIPSFASAVLVTWLLNRHTTFRNERRNNLSFEAVLYVTTQAAGAGINLLIFGAVLWLIPILHSVPVVALAAGAAGGFVFNYFVTTTYIYSTSQKRS